ncbi:hypothetical protein EVAR_51608_1 [Eumeta japonica]|uniref:PiggyBac transposable element-derived protein domain-containing protein n=1 Tax=Eumeta variegata TaxID=151549 RepID=A0A4C1YH84_EUMVA|nr:hypothetical protein EVAR_51608_1 [Eumeta japonica]
MHANFWREMAITRSHKSGEILQWVDDSEVDDDGEDEILVAEQRDDDGYNGEELLKQRSSVHRGTRTRGRSSARGRSRGCGQGRLSSYSRGRSRSLLPNLNDFEKAKASGWTYVAREVPPDRPIFHSPNGVNATVDQNSSQYDCIRSLWTSNFWKLIKTESNQYAVQMRAELARRQLKPGPMLSNWKPVTIGELKRFFNIILHMTLVQKESYGLLLVDHANYTHSFTCASDEEG